MVGPIDVKQKWNTSHCSWTNCVTSTVHLSHDFDLWFSRPNLEKLYPGNWIAVWREMKGEWVERKSDPLRDFELWPYQWPWHWILSSSISGIWRPIEMKGPWVDRMLAHNGTLSQGHDHGLSRPIWWQIRIPGIGLLIDIEWKGFDSVGSQTSLWLLTSILPMVLTWIFKVTFKKYVFQGWTVRLSWNERFVSRLRCWSHYIYATLSFDLNHDLESNF